MSALSPVLIVALALLAGVVPARAQTAAELVDRVQRLEALVRGLTGQVEQLQFRNRELEQQLRRFQEDVEFRFQENQPQRPGQRPQQQRPAQPPAGDPQRRSDAFDPSQNPSAAGAPPTLGTTAPSQPLGPPGGGRQAGGPLDLGALAQSALADPSLAPPGQRPAQNSPSATPARPPGGPAVAATPPAGTAREDYDAAYATFLRRDYAQAEQQFRQFLGRHGSDRLAPEARYWLGESLFQRGEYDDAAREFLTIATRNERSTRAPDAMLRLGQSLAALNQRDTACSTFAEIPRRFPQASVNVRQAATDEARRVRCPGATTP